MPDDPFQVREAIVREAIRLSNKVNRTEHAQDAACDEMDSQQNVGCFDVAHQGSQASLQSQQVSTQELPEEVSTVL